MNELIRKGGKWYLVVGDAMDETILQNVLTGKLDTITKGWRYLYVSVPLVAGMVAYEGLPREVKKAVASLVV